MKIAMMFDGLRVGGIERVGIDYIKLLHKLGHEVTVFNLSPNDHEMECEISPACEIINMRFSRRFAPELYSQFSKRGIGFKFLYPLIYVIVLALNFIYKIYCRCFIVKRRGYDVAIAFSGHYNDLTVVAENFVKVSKRMCWLHGALYGYALISDGYLNLYNKIKNLVVLVDLFQDEVIATNRQLSLNITKLYNPSFVADRKIDREKVNRLKNKYGDFVLMVGRLSKDKDQLTLIRAVEYIKEKYHFEKKVLLIGDGEKKQELASYAENCGLGKQIVFLGNCQDVQNYYMAAYLFAHSSPLEGLPTTLIESLYFELPIVATDSLPGVREVLGNNEFGLIVPVRDYVSLGEKIYCLYHDEELYNEYKEKSKLRFRDFDPNSIEKELKKIL